MIKKIIQPLRPKRQFDSGSASDGIVCVRAGYTRIMPHDCLVRNASDEEACGKCTAHRYSAAVMADAMDMGVDDVLAAVRAGDIKQHPLPFVRSESLPDHDSGDFVLTDVDTMYPVEQKDDIRQRQPRSKMNTRILYLNGRRMPQGTAFEFKTSGAFAERSLMIFFTQEFMSSLKGEIKEIFVDEYLNGRIVSRYEWIAGNIEYGPMTSDVITRGKNVTNVNGFRIQPVSTDTYIR